MKRANILFLLISSLLSFAMLLLLPVVSQGNNFKLQAQTSCETEGGSCYPNDYTCVDGVSWGLTCDAGSKCYYGGTCSASTGPTAGCPGGSINTALGCFYIQTPRVFIIVLLRIGAGLGGGIAFMLMVYAGFIIMTSSGDPKRLTAGKELLTAAIAGLLFLIGGVFVFRIIGVDLLGIF